MAKKKSRESKQEIVIRPTDLARALEGISASVQGLRRLVLQLPAAATITITVDKDQPSAFYWDYECPPPE